MKIYVCTYKIISQEFLVFYVFHKGIKKLGIKEKGQGRYTGKAEGRKLKSKNYRA